MGSLAINGSDVLMVNGRQVRYQGIANLRKDVTTAQAVQATAGDGYQKYFLESPDRQHRIVVWADHLDLSFESSPTVPQVTIDGKPYVMVAHDDEDTGVVSGFVRGAQHGIESAADATLQAAKGIIGNIGAVGALGVAGGTTLMLMRGLSAEAIAGTAVGLAVPALEVAGSAILIGTVLAGLAGGLKGAMDAASSHPNTEPLADVTEPGPVDTPNPNPTTPGQLIVNPDPNPQQPNVPAAGGYQFHRRNVSSERLGEAILALRAMHR